MEQAVAERPFSQEQHLGQHHSWHNGAVDRRGTNLLNNSQSRDPQRWTCWDGNRMCNNNVNGKDIREKNDHAPVCRDNLRGRCARGHSCKFQHVNHDGGGFCRSDQRNLGETSKAINSQLFGGSKDGESYRRSPCRKFQSGNCYRGSTCPYLHPQSSNFGKADVDKSSRSREGNQRSPCRNFQYGRCNHGLSCAYPHTEFLESDRTMHKLTAGQQHRIVTASRNFRFHEGSVGNNLITSHVHDTASNKENNSRSSLSRECQRSPCRNFLSGICHFGSSCSRWHPDHAYENTWSAGSSNNHDFAPGHKHINSSADPRRRPPCHFIHRGSSHQVTSSANLHPAIIYERTRYDFGAQHQQGGTTMTSSLNFDAGNIVREVNNHGVRPYHDIHAPYNRESINGEGRSLSSERKRSRPISDFGGDQLQPEVCLRFTKGRCDQGGNCRYLHSFHEYASSISQPIQKPHLQTTMGAINIDQANQCAERNENVNSWSRPSKRPRTWSTSSFSSEGNVRCTALTHDYSLGSYHRSRPSRELQNKPQDYHSFKYYGPRNRTNHEHHQEVTATSASLHENTDSDYLVMAIAGQGESMSNGMQPDHRQSGCHYSETAILNKKNEINYATGALRCNHADQKANDLVTVRISEGVTATSSRSLPISSSLDGKCAVPGLVVADDISTGVPKTGHIGDVLASDHRVEAQGDDAVTMSVQSIILDLSSADTRDESSLGATNNNLFLESQSSDAAILSSRKKLLVLDVNGLLADIVGDFPDRYKPDTSVGGKGVFKRPFCDDFLDFCFEKFDVGIWSSRTEKNVTRVLDCLMKKTKSKLLFCWHQSHCTQTGYKTVENNDKPLVLKELKKLWDKTEKDIPWEKGFYNETNTILLDDSPYKALRNPPYTAIFPFPYSFRNVEDKSLGPDGDLRVYLERLAEAKNVQNFIQENPFGQRPITKSNLSWAFYSKIAEEHASPPKPVAATISCSSEASNVSDIVLSLNVPAQVDHR